MFPFDCFLIMYTCTYMGKWTLRSITVLSRERHGVSKCQQLACLFNSLFKLTSKKTPKLRIAGPLWVHPWSKSPLQRASRAENLSISWRRVDDAGVSLVLENENTVHVSCPRSSLEIWNPIFMLTSLAAVRVLFHTNTMFYKMGLRVQTTN